MCFGGRTIIDDSEDEEPSLYLQQSTMWQAFDDIVEDTGQMAKAHVFRNIAANHQSFIGNVG